MLQFHRENDSNGFARRVSGSNCSIMRDLRNGEAHRRRPRGARNSNFVRFLRLFKLKTLKWRLRFVKQARVTFQRLFQSKLLSSFGFAILAAFIIVVFGVLLSASPYPLKHTEKELKQPRSLGIYSTLGETFFFAQSEQQLDTNKSDNSISSSIEYENNNIVMEHVHRTPSEFSNHYDQHEFHQLGVVEPEHDFDPQNHQMFDHIEDQQIHLHDEHHFEESKNQTHSLTNDTSADNHCLQESFHEDSTGCNRQHGSLPDESQTLDKMKHIESSSNGKLHSIKLSSLPKTEWLKERALYHFRLHHSRRRGHDNLISLKNACYCTHRNKFILPRRHKHGRHRNLFPKFMYRQGSAQGVTWNTPSSLLAFKHQEVVKVTGTTILWRGRGLHLKQSHLQKSLIPLRSVIDIMQHIRGKEKVLLAAEVLPNSSEANDSVSRLQDYFLGDIPDENRVSLHSLRPSLLCFNEIVSLGSEFENHVASTNVYEHVKSLIEKKEAGRLNYRLARRCKDSNANRRTIWIMGRQQAHGHTGSIDNIADVSIAVDHALIKTGLAGFVSLQVVQAPNVLCPRGTAREGCVDIRCSESTNDSTNCSRHGGVFEEAVAFNNMTFLITAVGAANQGFIYMPKGSYVVGISSHGVLDRSYEHLAKEAGLKYKRMENDFEEDIEHMLHERFGDIARSTTTCWSDSDCRAARLNQATHVDVHQLSHMLKDALLKWETECH